VKKALQDLVFITARHDNSHETVIATQRSRNYDLYLIFTAGIVLISLTLLSSYYKIDSKHPLNWILWSGRLILGLPFVLYIPGYLLQGLLFPQKDDLDAIERLGLSLGLSVASVTLLVLLLNSLPWRINTISILAGQCGVVFLLISLTSIVRRLLPAGQAFSPNLKPHLGRWWSGLRISEQRILLIMTAAFLLAIIAAAYVFLVPSPADYLTEFYMLGPNGLAEDFAREASVGQPLSVNLGITNHERKLAEYRIEVWQVDPLDASHRQLVGSSTPLSLQVGETRQWDQSWQPAWAGTGQQFEFLLFSNGAPDPYRQLLLWIDIYP
jgi:uncharacterized membrane protein